MMQRYFFLYIFFCFSHLTYGMAGAGRIAVDKRTSKDLQREWEEQMGTGLRRADSLEELKKEAGKDGFKRLKTEPGQILAVKNALEKKRRDSYREKKGFRQAVVFAASAQQESSDEDMQEVKKDFPTMFHFVVARR